MNQFLLQNKPITDPASLFRARDSVYATDLLITAIGYLDFFSFLSDNPSSMETICDSLQIADRPLDVMLTLFTAMGLVTNHNGVFSVTELTNEHLVRDSYYNLGPYFSSLKERPSCQEMFKVLKSGKPTGWSGTKEQDKWVEAMEREDFADSFTSAMDSRGAFLAPALAEKLDCSKYRSLLDVAGGSGIYACAIAANNPQLKAAVLEKPPVDRMVRTGLENKGMHDRISVIAGDMFDGLPEEYDIHLYSHVLHDWDSSAVQSLLQRSYDTLPKGGTVAVFDAHLNANKTGPLSVAEYSVLMMFSTEGKCYSVGEMQQYLETAGFIRTTNTEVTEYRSLITAIKH